LLGFGSQQTVTACPHKSFPSRIPADGELPTNALKESHCLLSARIAAPANFLRLV
jgi:hypothetical protein